MMNEGSYYISQTISGNKHQIAGRDIINNDRSIKLDPNNPKLMPCHCRKLISKGADKCPECGHNHRADRIAEYERLKQEREQALQMLFVIALMILAGAVKISSHLSISFSSSFGISVILAGALWIGYIHLVAYLTQLFEKHFNGVKNGLR